MTNEEFRDAHDRLGLSAAKLAEKLQMSAHGGRTIRRWRKDTPVPGPVAVAMKSFLNDQARAGSLKPPTSAENMTRA